MAPVSFDLRESLAPAMRRWGSWKVLIVLIATFMIAVLWMVTIERIGHEYADAVRSSVKQNSNLVIAFEEHTVRTIKSVEQVLTQIAREYRDKGRDLDIHRLVDEGGLDHVLFHNVGIIDETGRLAAAYHLVRNLDFSGQEVYLAPLESGTDRLHVGKPIFGRGAKQWVVPMSRRLTLPDGSFAGVVYVGVDPYYFTRFYQRADLGTSGVVNLVGLDGITRARQAGDESSFGQDRNGNSLMVEQAKAPVGNMLTKGKQEGVPRFQSYRTLTEYPLIVAVGTSQQEGLADFHGRRRYYVFGAALASLFIGACAFGLIVLLSRHKRAAALVANSEARFRAMFSQAAAGIVLSSLDGRVTDANQVLCAGLGYSREELIGMPVTRLVDAGELPNMMRERERLQRGEVRTITREQCYVRKDGSKGWANRSIALVHDSGSGKGYFLSVFQDITDNKETRHRLEVQNTVLATQQEASLDAILVVDENARIVSCNRKFMEMWKISPELIRAGDDEPVLRAVFGQMRDPETFLARVRYLYEHPQETSSDELVTLDGRTIDRYSAPVMGADGTQYGRVWYFRDVTDRVSKDRELRQSESRFRQMAGTIGEVFWMASPDAHSTIYVSPAFESIWGLPCAELLKQPHRWLEAIHTEDRPMVERSLAALANGTPYDIDYRIRRPDGTLRWVNDRGYALRDDSGAVVLTSGVAIDVTERRRAEEQSQLSAKAFESIADGVIVTDPQQRIVSVNNAFTIITGYQREEILGKTPKSFQSGRHDASFYAAMWEEIGRNGCWRGEIWDRRKNGEVYPELLSISAVKDSSGATTHYVGVCTDISSLKQYEKQLHHQAHHDALTGLPNRVLFQDRFRESLGRAQRHGHLSAVLFLDLDHFKNVNDSLGHAVGDLLLQAVGKRLTAAVREIDTVARFGGDEFAVLLDTVRDSQDAAIVAQKLLDALALPFELEGHAFYISVSIGIGCYPQDGANIEVLFKNADTAMYRAKAEGRNNYQFFSADMNARALESLQMSNHLRLALERDELLLHYQPCVDLKSGRVNSAEALIRWNHPELGLVAPARFIPLAEETGLIEPIGEWVLKAACRQMRRWQDAGLPLNRVAVNLSARQFRHPNLVQRIAAILEETRLPAHHLELEVTESMVMQNPEGAADVLSQLKAMGITIAIDDFGTGYSSLSYLKRFPIDFLKIDRSFVSGVQESADDAAITKAIISLARSLNLRLIAEGVETAEQRAFLERHGCDEAQGYLFSRPVPAAEIEAILSAAQARAGSAALATA